MPSTNETPIDEPKTPNPERLGFFDMIGRFAIEAVRDNEYIEGHELHERFVGSDVVRRILSQDIFFYREGAPVDLSRFEGEREDPGTWKR